MQAAAPQSDKEAMAQALTSAKPEDFDIQGRENVQDYRKQEQITKLKEWVGQIDQFIKFLNGTELASVQVQLHAAPCDSIFEDIARSEKKKISRLAAELSSLSESLKGYLISANDR
jgi:hypothetical protein